MAIRTHITTSLHCSNCLALLGRAAVIGDNLEGPRVGCISICIHCAQVCVFKDDLTLRNITDEEMLGLELHHADAFFCIQKAISLIKLKNRLN